jgi:lipocalin
MSSLRGILTIAGLGLAAAFSPVSVPSLRRERLGVNPLSSLNLTQFIGRWYQAYANAFVDSTFEKDNYCVTADYGLNSNGSISVFNRARIGAPDGPESQIKGYAVPTSTPGELTVYLQGVPAVSLSAGRVLTVHCRAAVAAAPFNGRDESYAADVGAPFVMEREARARGKITARFCLSCIVLQGAPYWVFGLGPATFGASGLYEYALVSDYFNLSLFVLARNVTDYMAVYDAEVQTALMVAGFTNVLNKPIVTPRE